MKPLEKIKLVSKATGLMQSLASESMLKRIPILAELNTIIEKLGLSLPEQPKEQPEEQSKEQPKEQPEEQSKEQPKGKGEAVKKALDAGELDTLNLHPSKLRNIALSLSITIKKKGEKKAAQAKRINQSYLNKKEVESVLGRDKLVKGDYDRMREIAAQAGVRGASKSASRAKVRGALQKWVDTINSGIERRAEVIEADSAISRLKANGNDIPLELAIAAKKSSVYGALDASIAAALKLNYIPGPSSPKRTGEFDVLGNLHEDIHALPEILKANNRLGDVLMILANRDTGLLTEPGTTSVALAKALGLPSNNKELNQNLYYVISTETDEFLKVASASEVNEFNKIQAEKAAAIEAKHKAYEENKIKRDKIAAATKARLNAALSLPVDEMFVVFREELATKGRDQPQRMIQNKASFILHDIFRRLQRIFPKDALDKAYAAWYRDSRKITDDEVKELFPDLHALADKHDASDMHLFDQYLDEIKYLVKQLEAQGIRTDPEPTAAQAKAGNYKKGHMTVIGLDIIIENPKGSTRKGVDDDGKEWSSKMHHHYGSFKGTKGADGDPVDVFIGENETPEKVFVVDQIDPSSRQFDEHKVMLGFDSMEEAKKAYFANYEANWQGFGAIKVFTVDKFKQWLSGGKKKAAVKYIDGNFQEKQKTMNDRLLAPEDYQHIPAPELKAKMLEASKNGHSLESISAVFDHWLSVNQAA